MAWLIKKGFTPTQIADSFAIASGGATHFRNNVRRLMKTGLSKAEAEQRAFLEFQELTEANQQSSRADLISQQQASGLGRTILAWSNTPMQYMRIQENQFDCKYIQNVNNVIADYLSRDICMENAMRFQQQQQSQSNLSAFDILLRSQTDSVPGGIANPTDNKTRKKYKKQIQNEPDIELAEHTINLMTASYNQAFHHAYFVQTEKPQKVNLLR